jgi:ABC-type transporter Mla maintaining outer membrane lipid asymmetry permease subunit MlaE
LTNYDNPFIGAIALLGQTCRVAWLALKEGRLNDLDWVQIKDLCHWMGFESLPLVSLSAIFIGLALTVQTVLELQVYGAQDLAGKVITPLLLRELGSLTVSLAWSARVAAYVATEAEFFSKPIDETAFAKFTWLRLLVGIAMAVPLSTYGLVVGFLSAAIFAPTLGTSSFADFLESARVTIKERDLWVYFTKLVLINPTIAVLAGAVFGRIASGQSRTAAANAVTATFLVGYAVNLGFTCAVYLP